jgi:hypothetical protein
VTLCNSQILPELPVFTSLPPGAARTARTIPCPVQVQNAQHPSKWLSSDPENHSIDPLARREKRDARARFLLRKADYHRKALVRQLAQD